MIRIFKAPIEELVRLNPFLSPLLNEDWLNLEMDDVDTIEGQKRLDLSQTNILIKNNSQTLLDVNIASLKRNDVNFLYSKVSGFPTSQKKCLTGLILHHAVENLDGVFKYEPLFQPVFLTYVRKDPTSHSSVYKIEHFGDHYIYSLGSFILCTDFVQRKKYYREKISIKVEDQSPFRDFIQGTDAETILFSFQLIYTLMEHNGNDSVLFHNCVSGTDNSFDRPLYHSVLLSSKEVQNTGLFAGKYANRSHLCPPCNSDFGFNLTPQ